MYILQIIFILNRSGSLRLPSCSRFPRGGCRWCRCSGRGSRGLPSCRCLPLGGCCRPFLWCCCCLLLVRLRFSFVRARPIITIICASLYFFRKYSGLLLMTFRIYGNPTSCLSFLHVLGLNKIHSVL